MVDLLRVVKDYEEIVEVLKQEQLNYLNKPRYVPKKLVLYYTFTNFQGRTVESTVIHTSERAEYLILALDELVRRDPPMTDLYYELRVYESGGK